MVSCTVAWVNTCAGVARFRMPRSSSVLANFGLPCKSSQMPLIWRAFPERSRFRIVPHPQSGSQSWDSKMNKSVQCLARMSVRPNRKLRENPNPDLSAQKYPFKPSILLYLYYKIHTLSLHHLFHNLAAQGCPWGRSSVDFKSGLLLQLAF